jgi:outer membrane protein assembly factor BamB
MKECPYYKRVSHTRAALMLTFALSVAAWPAASMDEPRTPVWPVAAAWTSDFPVGATISLVMDESRVFVIEGAAVSAWSDAAMLWKSELTATARPVVDEGRIFVPVGDAIHALSVATGAQEWRLAVGKSPVSPTARSGWLIATTEDNSLLGVSSAQGREVWRIALPAPLAAPVVIDGDLVVGAGFDGLIRAWQVTDGAMRWEREIGTRPTQLLAASGAVFVGGEDGRLISLRPRDGRINWAYSYDMPIAGQLASDERHVYATTIDNSVHAHAFNGHRTWHKLLASRVVNGMFSDSGFVFVPQSTGEIRIFLARDGARAGRLSAPSDEAAVVGGMVAGGAGDQLRMAVTVSVGPRLALNTYRRTGLGAAPATVAPPGAPLLLALPGGRP